MDLERIIQMENESVEDFVKRAIDTAKNTDKHYELMFLNGKILKTENYNLKEENFDINLIMSDLEKEETTNIEKTETKSEINAEVTQYIDFLETTLLEKRKEQAESLEQKLQSLNEKLEKEQLRIKKLNNKLSKDAKSQTEMIKKLEADKLAILDTKITKLEEEIKASLNTIKDKEEEFQKANQLLEDYHIKLKQCKNAENPDTDLMEELEEKIEYQTKVVENYQEHLEYLKEEHNKLKDDKNENISKRKAVQADAHKKLVDLKNEIENKIGKLNGKSLDINNVPTIQELKSKISETSNKIEILKQPVDFTKSRELIASKASTAELVAELNSLIKGFETEEIENTLGLQISVENREKEIEKKKEQINQIDERLNNKNNYLKTEEIENDQQERERLETRKQELTEEIEKLEDRLEKIETLPHLKSDLKTLRRNREYLEDKLEFCVTPDEKEIIEVYEKRIEKIKAKEEKITAELEETKGILAAKALLTKVFIENKLKKLKKQRKENNQLLIKINKKTEEDYIDEDRMIADETELSALKSELDELENRKDELQTITMIELVSEIAAKHMEISNGHEQVEEEEIELEEPIERYEDAPKSLIEKIKSTSFIKKAAKAMAGIVAGVLIIAGVSGLSQKDKNNMNVITEETEEKDEEQEIEEETVVKEETDEETKDTKSMIEQMQEDALQDIIDKGTEAVVHQDVFTAASNENEKKVGNNTLSWENATPGGIYAVKDNEKVKINLQAAEKYINEGYDIVSAYINEGEIIGFDKLELTQGLGLTEKTR